MPSRAPSQPLSVFSALVWCDAGSGGDLCQAHSATKSAVAALSGRFCEEALGAEICPWQFFGFLDVTSDRWAVNFPVCDTFMPTQYEAARNEFAILASSSIERRGEEDFGALLLQFQNTSANDPAWVSMADAHSCSLECIRRDGSAALHVTSLQVKCPQEGNADSLPPLTSCTLDSPNLLLLPAGLPVASADSAREGEMCDWSQAPLVNMPAPGGGLLDGLPAVVTTLASATTLLLSGLAATGKSILLARALHSQLFVS